MAWTRIPSTQPSCGSITIAVPTPHCPSIPSDPLGCFIQPTGLYCAPLSTTRGFLYTLDITNTTTPSSTTITTTITSMEEGPSTAAGAKVTLIPQLRIPSPPQNASLVGVDGQPVKSQGPALLGQVCTTIPLPPTTHPAWPVLVAMANKQLNETVGFSNIGTGASVFTLRGDCETGAFCDTSSGLADGEGKGVCVEQLPNYHTCSSYFQCISLRCSDQDHMASNPVKRRMYEEEQEKGGSRSLDGVEIGGRQVESISSSSSKSSPSYHHQRHRRLASSQRRVSVCLPLSRESPGSGTGTSGNAGGNKDGPQEPKGGDSEHHEIPGWAVAIIGAVMLVCILGGLVLIKRRRLKMQELKGANLARASSTGGGASGGRERERSMSVSAAFGLDEKHRKGREYGHHSRPPTITLEEVPERAVFSRWFRASKKSAVKPSCNGGEMDNNDIKARKQSMSTVDSYRTYPPASVALDSAYSGGASIEGGYARYEAGTSSEHSSRRTSGQASLPPRRGSGQAIPQVTTTFSETRSEVIPSVCKSEVSSGASTSQERQSTDAAPSSSLGLGASPVSRFEEGETPFETRTPSSTHGSRPASRPATSSSSSLSRASSPRSISTRMSHSPNLGVPPTTPGSPISPISPMSPSMGSVGTSRLSSRTSYRHANT